MVRPTTLTTLLLIFLGLGFSPASTAKGDNPSLETLRKKFKGKLEWDKGSNRYSLVYTFTKKEQFEDFLFSEGPPKVQPRGGLTLAAGESLKHKALWDEAKIAATVLPVNPQGTLIRAGEVLEVGLGKPTTASNKIQILEKGKLLVQQTYKLKDFQNRAIPLEWSIDKKKSALNFGGILLGSAHTQPIEEPLAIEFVASKGDLIVGGLRITGKWDPEWIKKELAPQDEKAGKRSPNEP